MHLLISNEAWRDKYHMDSQPIATVVAGSPDIHLLQEYVGGMVDAVTCWGHLGGRRVTMWVHDEGLLIGLPPTLVVDHPNGYEQPLVGNVVVTADDAEGETVDMTEDEVERFLAAWTEGRFVHPNLGHFPEYDGRRRAYHKAGLPVLRFVTHLPKGDRGGGYSMNGVMVVDMTKEHEVRPVAPTVARMLDTEEVEV